VAVSILAIYGTVRFVRGILIRVNKVKKGVKALKDKLR